VTHVKICGIKRVEDGLAAVQAGADLLGFVFAPSPRRVEAATVSEIVATVKDCSPVRTVGVFVNADVSTMNRLAGMCRLDYIQLCGDEADDVINVLDIPAIRTVHVAPRDESAEALTERVNSSSAELVLLDTARVGQYGGTGEPFDWAALPPLNRPVLLAGGLNPSNVGAAIRMVRPWGVDVSSGVERNGEKDPDAIRDFVRVAHGN
jgi:phosphoribosylanthranilate isomerase